MNSALNNMTSIDRKIDSKNQSTNPTGGKAQEKNAIVNSDNGGGARNRAVEEKE